MLVLLPFSFFSTFLLLLGFLASIIGHVDAENAQEVLNEEKSQNRPSYVAGQPIPISCLNRTVDTGEHISDAAGHLQYIPFPTCNETGRPLELYFGVERELNCTIASISDTFFHLLEFYIHNDAPLTCRIPARPLENSNPVTDDPDDFVPLIFALTGVMQLSHLHISTNMNVLLHAGPRASAPGMVAAAIAYSIPEHAETRKRIIIGDPLSLKLSIRWYPTVSLPSGWTGYGGHIYASTVVYCLLSAGVGVAASIAWFRGVELPRRLRTYSGIRAGGERGYHHGAGYGYGYGFGNGGAKKD